MRVTCPAQRSCLSISMASTLVGVCSRQDLFVGDVVTEALDAHDGSQAPLVERVPTDYDLLSAEDPGFCPVEKSGEDCSPVNLDLG